MSVAEHEKATMAGDHPTSDEARAAYFRARPDFGLDRFSGVYVMIVMVVVFTLLEPSTFGTVNNARIIASSQAITGILTLGLIVSLISGVFDLSVGANMSLAIALVAWLQATAGVNPVLAVVITVLTGSVVGVANALVVTSLGVDPVIGTLGMQAILSAMAYWVSGGKTVTLGISPAFSRLGIERVGTIPITVFYLIAVALILWYLLEHTPVGRYFYAIGANPQAARLAGLRVRRLQWTSLLISGTLASVAGVVLTMQLGAASYGAGFSYLLPAFAAAFLGATQIRPGRFNVGGTLVALYLLAVGVKGLQLRYPSLPWIKDLFTGVALVLSVALANRSARRRTVAA